MPMAPERSQTGSDPALDRTTGGSSGDRGARGRRTLIVSGERADEVRHRGSELWRTPFLGWGVDHVLTAPAHCRPERYLVIDEDGRRLEAVGFCEVVLLRAGDRFTLRVQHP